jgi:hypothetical protein
MEYERLSARAFPPPSARCSLGSTVFIYHIPLLAPTFPHSHLSLASGHVLDANVRDGFPIQFMRAPRLIFAEGGRRMGTLDVYAGQRAPYPASDTLPRVRTLLGPVTRRTLRLVVAEASPPRPRRSLFRPQRQDMRGA